MYSHKKKTYQTNGEWHGRDRGLEPSLGRKQLMLLIRKLKKKCWNDLCENLDTDIWGDSYRLATKELRRQTV